MLLILVGLLRTTTPRDAHPLLSTQTPSILICFYPVPRCTLLFGQPIQVASHRSSASDRKMKPVNLSALREAKYGCPKTPNSIWIDFSALETIFNSHRARTILAPSWLYAFLSTKTCIYSASPPASLPFWTKIVRFLLGSGAKVS